jgi:hypothetical protein
MSSKDSRLCLERISTGVFLAFCEMAPHNLVAGCSSGLQRQTQQKVDSAWKQISISLAICHLGYNLRAGCSSRLLIQDQIKSRLSQELFYILFAICHMERRNLAVG